MLLELNLELATFRDLLVHVGGTRDTPEMRENVRKVRRRAAETILATCNTLLPNIKM